MRLAQRQRLGAVARDQHPVAESAQDLVHQSAHGVLVLRQQNRLVAAGHRARLGGVARRLHQRFGPRQVDPEGRAPSRCTLDGDVASVLLDDPVHGGEPEAASLLGRLGREEGLEDPLARLLVHPVAGVARLEQDVRPARGGRMGCYERRVELDVARLDRQASALRHRVARVDREVHDHLLELAGIRHDRREARFERDD